MEVMLCSLASPCFLMWVRKGGQDKKRTGTSSRSLNMLLSSAPRFRICLNDWCERPGNAQGLPRGKSQPRSNITLTMAGRRCWGWLSPATVCLCQRDLLPNAFLPIFIEELARDNNFLLPDKTIPFPPALCHPLVQ
jgi:hypothetical protein